MLLAVLLSFFSSANAFPTLNFFSIPGSDEPGEELGSPQFLYKVIVSVVLVLAGGVFAGYVHMHLTLLVVISHPAGYQVSLSVSWAWTSCTSASSPLPPMIPKNAKTLRRVRHVTPSVEHWLTLDSLEPTVKRSSLGPCRTFSQSSLTTSLTLPRFSYSAMS